MKISRNARSALWLALLLLVAATVSRCVPEKSAALDSKIIPIRWLNETTLSIRQGDSSFTVNPTNPTATTQAQAADSWETRPPTLALEPRHASAFSRTEGAISVVVAGETIRLPTTWDGRHNGMNQGFPRFAPIPFHTYRHLGQIGLLTFTADAARMIPLPQLYPDNLSPPAVIWDAHAGRFFAFQTGCDPNQDATCHRTAWWLDRALNVVETLPLPAEDLLHQPEKLACFSCGCGCYTQEDIYAVNGKIYVQASGFPLSDQRRGLYEVVQADNGTSTWRQVIKGRIEPPLAFSPSGCNVAFFKVSYFGDALQTQSLCN